jgi:hypothetical protein
VKRSYRTLGQVARSGRTRRSSRRSLVNLEIWQWVVLVLLGVAAAGGIFQLTQVRQQTAAWQEFLERASRTALVFEVNPDYTADDETGRRRRLHEFLGEYRWQQHADVSAARKSAVDLWLLQLSNFTYDHGKIYRDDPVWQSVAHTWKTRKGVCRDSATVLADMLAHHGHEARMVVGFVAGPDWGPAGGHAWVGLVDPDTGREYLLESTGETQHSRLRTPPRVAVKIDYTAEMQIVSNGYYTLDNPGVRNPSLTKGWTFSRVR